MERERGFTLVELMVVVAMLGIIVTPISSSIIAGLRSTTASTERLTEANGVELLASYFQTDVLQSDSVAVNTVDCSTSSPAGMSLVLDTSGSDVNGFDQLTDVSYRVSGTSIIRRVAVCTATDPATETVKEKTVASGLATSSPFVLSFTCGSSACAAGSEGDFTKLTLDVTGITGNHFLLQVRSR